MTISFGDMIHGTQPQGGMKCKQIRENADTQQSTLLFEDGSEAGGFDMVVLSFLLLFIMHCDLRLLILLYKRLLAQTESDPL